MNHPLKRFHSFGLILAPVLVLAGQFPYCASGQEILAPPPPEAGPRVPLPPGTGSPGEAETGFLTDVLSSGESVLQSGVGKLQPRGYYQFSYGDRLQSSPGSTEKTIIHTISPGVTIALGEKWAVDYEPSIRVYSSDEFRDTLEHSVIFSGGTVYEDWSFGLSQTYRNSDSPRVETGTQTEEDRFVTSLSAVHQLNNKVSIQLGLNQNLRFAEEFIDVYQWSTMNWLDYSFAEDLRAGVGVGAGYVEVSEGVDSVYEQAMGRVVWQAGDKLNLSVNGGLDFRQFLDTDLSTLVNPLYGLSATYQLFETTSLVLNGSRNVTASYYQDQVTENARISGGLRQRILGRFNLSLSGGYRYTSYVEIVEGFDQAREDEGFFFSSRLSTTLRDKLTIGIFYHWSENNSNDEDFSQDSSQMGFDISYRF